MTTYETLKSEAQAAAENNAKWHSGNATFRANGVSFALYVAQQQRSNKVSRRAAYVATHYINDKKVSKEQFVSALSA